MEQEDLEHTFTEDEVQDIKDWIESLTLIDLAALKDYWEKTQDQSSGLQ